MNKTINLTALALTSTVFLSANQVVKLIECRDGGPNAVAAKLLRSAAPRPITLLMCSAMLNARLEYGER
jgi:hypothetical protein